MKRLNSFLSGIALLAGWSVLALVGAVVCLQVGPSNDLDGSEWKGPLVTSHLGEFFEGGDFRSNALDEVYSDGRVHSYSDPKVGTLTQVVWFGSAAQSSSAFTDYHRPAKVDQVWWGNWSWKLERGRGIHAYASPSGLAGSLSDQGWVEDRKVTSSFSRAFWWRWDSGSNRVVYLTPEGIHVANLVSRTLTHLVKGQIDPGTCLIFSPGEAFVACLTPHNLYSARIGTNEAPGAVIAYDFRVDADLTRLGMGDQGRLILRSEISGTRTVSNVDYEILVFSGSGDLESKYTHSLRVPPGLQLLTREEGALKYIAMQESEFRRKWSPSVKFLTSLLLPPLPLQVMESTRTSSWEYIRIKYLLREIHNLPLGYAISTLLAGWVLLSCRKRRRGILATGTWVLLALAFGIAGALTYRSLARFEKLEACPGCGTKSPASDAACGTCGKPAVTPEPLGIEMLRTA